MCIVKAHWLFLFSCLILGFSACQVSPAPRPVKLSSHSSRAVSSTRSKHPKLPMRSPSSELPDRSTVSRLSPYNVGQCIKENMLKYLGIPDDFVEEVELTDHSKLILLRNPYTKAEGVYFRIKKELTGQVNLALYKNHLSFVSNRWYELLDICR